MDHESTTGDVAFVEVSASLPESARGGAPVAMLTEPLGCAPEAGARTPVRNADWALIGESPELGVRLETVYGMPEGYADAAVVRRAADASCRIPS